MRRLLALAWILAAPAGAVEVDTLFKAQVLGGQYFFSGQKSDLAGNASVLAAPALKFGEEFALLPVAQASYQGAKRIVDLAGAGTLFQEQMDYRAAARAVWAPRDSPWRLKPSFTYKYELLKETKDEDWGGGLFDYQKWSFGTEAEYVWREPFSWRLGVDYYEVSFPNYTSLESQAALQFQGQSLARELVGDHVLDTQNVGVSLALDGPLHERVTWEGSAAVTYRRFPRQRVVDSVGGLTGDSRQDVYTAARLAARMPAELNRDLRVLGALELGFAYNASDQNSYDAAGVRYTPYYYNYGEWRLEPSLKFLAGPQGPGTRPMVLELTGSWWRRRYPYRTAQDAAGAYGNGGLHTAGWSVGANLSYPMLRRWSLVLDARLARTSSNQDFEQFYRYNYSSANYLFGVSYEY
ncbi:MAG: hypothetical protein HY926_02705 [Elusimicrobia bacterium]|nr:hypothetical protein [Elusimicrobiota bacterium]